MYICSNTDLKVGHVTDYMIKIEFQIRGSPHAHCLLWVNNAPRINQDPDEVMCEFMTNISVHHLLTLLIETCMMETLGELSETYSC